MSPEAVNYMTIAQTFLNRAELNFLAEFYEDAARNSYSAVLNAARAVIFERLTIAPRTHAGTRSKFSELVHSGLAFDQRLVEFLRLGFETKQSIDYGPELVFVPREQAQDYLARARAFLAAARAVCD